MLNLGVRIELYEHVGNVGEDSRDLLGAVAREDGLECLAVPAVGEHIALGSLRAASPRDAVLRGGAGNGPFLPVRGVEHYPTPWRDGQVAAWYDLGKEPSVYLVLHAPVDADEAGERLLRQFHADGWHLTVFHDSPLGPLYDRVMGHAG